MDRYLPYAASILFLVACGDPNERPPPNTGDPNPQQQPDTRDILQKLEDVPGIASVSEQPVSEPWSTEGARFFVLEIEQPVDHARPQTGAFRQTVTLFFRSEAAPMILASTGYGIVRQIRVSEPAALLGANQLSVEHRFFNTSRPEPLDWSALDIEQAAGDHHRIVQLLRPLFPARWLSTGASKGGMTSVYHRMFYPDDVDATLAYVAPNSYGVSDERYVAFLDAVGDAACRNSVRALQRAVLENRSQLEPLMIARAATAEDTFDVLGTARAFEFATVEAPFALWQ